MTIRTETGNSMLYKGRYAKGVAKWQEMKIKVLAELDLR